MFQGDARKIWRAVVCLTALFAITAATSSARIGPDRQAVKCGLPWLATEAARSGNDLGVRSALYPSRAELADSLPHTYETPDSRFLIHYTLEGTHTIAWGDRDDDEDGVYDFINEVAAALDSVWRIEIDSLGYYYPPPDEGRGGDNRFDVYLYEAKLGGNLVFGLAYPETYTCDHPLLDEKVTSSYIFVHPSYPKTDFGYDDPTIPLKVTLAHEFFHACQFVYHYNDTYLYNNLWLYESTAVWMEDQVFPDIDDYKYFLTYFFDRPWISLDLNLQTDFHMYGACVWPHYLSQEHDREIIHNVWSRSNVSKVSSSLNLYKYVFTNRGLDIGDEFTRFAVWNYFTGDRAAQGPSGGYEDAAIYPEITEFGGVVFDSTWIEVAVPDTNWPRHLAANYIAVENSTQNDTLRIVFSGDSLAAWRVPVLLDSLSGGWGETEIEIDSLGGGEIVIGDWNKMNGLVLVTAASIAGGGPFDNIIQLEVARADGIFAVSEPENRPDKLVLHQNYPNPFNPVTNISFELPERALVDLSIYDIRGHLVSRPHRGTTEPGRWNVVWDGRDLNGSALPSGVYFYRLEARYLTGERRNLTGRMVLVK